MRHSSSARFVQTVDSDTQITLSEAVTWYSTRIGVTTPEAAAEAIGTAMSEQVTAFSTVWTEIHAAEPGRGRQQTPGFEPSGQCGRTRQLVGSLVLAPVLAPVRVIDQAPGT